MGGCDPLRAEYNRRACGRPARGSGERAPRSRGDGGRRGYLAQSCTIGCSMNLPDSAGTCTDLFCRVPVTPHSAGAMVSVTALTMLLGGKKQCYVCVCV